MLRNRFIKESMPPHGESVLDGYEVESFDSSSKG